MRDIADRFIFGSLGAAGNMQLSNHPIYIMELTSLSAISAIDGRYRKQVQHLDDYFSEYALMKYRVRVEVEYLFLLSQKKFFRLSAKAARHLQTIRDEFNP